MPGTAEVGLTKGEDGLGAVSTAELAGQGSELLRPPLRVGWNRGRTLPPPNNHQARKGGESGPKSTWGPREAETQAGHEVGKRASCSITQGLMALVVPLGT